MLYKDWLVEWLVNYVKPSTKDKTYSRYADVVNQHLIPNVGDYDLRNLTPLTFSGILPNCCKTVI